MAKPLSRNYSTWQSLIYINPLGILSLIKYQTYPFRINQYLGAATMRPIAEVQALLCDRLLLGRS